MYEIEDSESPGTEGSASEGDSIPGCHLAGNRFWSSGGKTDAGLIALPRPILASGSIAEEEPSGPAHLFPGKNCNRVVRLMFKKALLHSQNYSRLRDPAAGAAKRAEFFSSPGFNEISPPSWHLNCRHVERPY